MVPSPAAWDVLPDETEPLTTLAFAPLVVTTIPPVMSDRDVEEVLGAFDDLYDAGITFASLIDTRALSTVPNSRQRQRLAQWAIDAVPRTRRFGVCTCYVVTSFVARAVLAAISWVFEHPTPTAYVATIDEGLDFCLRHLTARGLSLPEGIDALRECATH